MLSFLTGIWDTVTGLVGFVINIIVSLVRFITMIPVYTGYVSQLFNWLPYPFVTFAVLGLSITVILMVIGRQT